MRTAILRQAGSVLLATAQTFGPTLLSGLTLGLAFVALNQQVTTSLGTDPGVQLGLWLGIGFGGLWGLSARSTGRWSRTADWLYLAVVVGLWPLWLTTLVDGLGSLPAAIWQSTAAVNGIGCVLGLLAAVVPAALITKLSRLAQSRPLLCGTAAVIGMLLQTIVFGANTGVFWPAIVAIGVCAALSVRASTASISTVTASEPAPSPWLLLCSAVFLGVAIGSVPQWIAELWPVTAVTTNISLAMAILGVVLGHAFSARCVSVRSATAATTLVCTLLLFVSSISVDAVLWQNATFTTWWQWETVRTAALFLIGGSLGACVAFHGNALKRNAVQTFAWCAAAIGLGACLALVAIGVPFGPRTGLALAAFGGLLCHGTTLIPASKTSQRRSWSVAAGMTTALLLCLWQGGMSWNSARASRILFSTTAVLAHRSGWEPRLLERIDDTRLVTSFTGRTGAWTVWQNKGGEWHLRENGVPVGAISLAPAWYPQFAPEAAAALWPLVLVDQPERVLMLGAGSGTALRMCSAFPVQEVICHEADAPLIRFIQGPLAAASGYDPFADRCRWVSQPAEWLALSENDRYDVIVSSPRMAAQQANLVCYTTDYYRRAARHLTEQGVFCQRFSGVDLGPKPLLSASMAMHTAFAETACVEVSAGEYLLLGANSPEALIRNDLASRLENKAAEVATVLNWDWSFPLNLPAYDGAALKEAADELHVGPHSAYRTGMAFVAPYEMMRWGPKLQETAVLLSKPRTSAPRFPLPAESGEPLPLASASTSRKGRYLEWLGAAGEHAEVLRRLSEYMGEQKLIREYPDTHWWEYRKVLREQLQDHPRSTLQQVKFTTDSPGKWHSEDSRRKAYFEALGDLAQDEHASYEAYQTLDSVLEPHDPLLSLFGHQELAELLSRRNKFPADERRHRLHAIYYAPGHDASVRNVVLAIERLTTLPDPELSGTQRFDELNGLLQTLRGRWEARNQRPLKAAQVTLQEMERSQLAVEHALEVMEPLAPEAGYTASDWANRKEVLERMLLRPFRSHRDELVVRVRESEARTKALLEKPAE